jgi:hypothetical protein
MKVKNVGETRNPVDGHFRFWYNVPPERCTLRSLIFEMKGLKVP